MELNVQSDQVVVIAILFVLPSKKTCYFLFSEIIFVDSVADTNSDKRSLLTLTDKVSKG